MRDMSNAVLNLDRIRNLRVLHNYLQMKARRKATKGCDRFDLPENSIQNMTYILPTLDCG